MNFIEKLFRKNAENKVVEQPKKHSTNIPSYIAPANKIINKEFDSAIKDLETLLKKTNPNDVRTLSMIHLNLSQAYFKKRNEDISYFDLSTHHAMKAFIYGHNTGIAPHRIITNLEKNKKYKQSIEVCEIVTSDEYHFSVSGNMKENFLSKMKKLEKNFEKFGDNCSGKLFTNEEKEMIINNSQIEVFEKKELPSEEEFLKMLEKGTDFEL